MLTTHLFLVFKLWVAGTAIVSFWVDLLFNNAI